MHSNFNYSKTFKNLLYAHFCRSLYGSIRQAQFARYQKGVPQPIRQSHHQWPVRRLDAVRRQADEETGPRAAQNARGQRPEIRLQCTHAVLAAQTGIRHIRTLDGGADQDVSALSRQFCQVHT